MTEPEPPNPGKKSRRGIVIKTDMASMFNGGVGRTPEQIKEHYRQIFEAELDAIAERVPLVGPMLLPAANDEMDYLDKLVREARDLFIFGHFYSCIVMCGAVSERIMKDICKSNIRLKTESGTTEPTEKFLRCLENVDLSKLLDLCEHGGMIDNEVRQHAQRMMEIRNKYAHAKGKEAESDALKSIGLLNKIVAGTVSTDNWDIGNGGFIWKRVGRSPSESEKAD